MKRLIAAAVIVALILAVSITGNVTVHKYSNGLKEKTNEVLKCDVSLTEIKANELFEYWDKVKGGLSVFINQSDLNEIGLLVNRLKNTASSEDKTEALSVAEEIDFIISRIDDEESFNIFTLL